MKSIISKILFQLKKRPLTFTQLRALCYKVSKGINLNKKIPNKIHAGFYGDAIRHLKSSGIIAKRKNLYHLTEKGRLNINGPYVSPSKMRTSLLTKYEDLKRIHQTHLNNRGAMLETLNFWKDKAAKLEDKNKMLEDVLSNNKTFPLSKIIQAVDIAIGDDGFRSNEVKDILLTDEKESAELQEVEFTSGCINDDCKGTIKGTGYTEGPLSDEIVKYIYQECDTCNFNQFS